MRLAYSLHIILKIMNIYELNLDKTGFKVYNNAYLFRRLMNYE